MAQTFALIRNQSVVRLHSTANRDASRRIKGVEREDAMVLASETVSSTEAARSSGDSADTGDGVPYGTSPPSGHPATLSAWSGRPAIQIVCARTYYHDALRE
jgi:hypothetical protein